MRASFNGVIFFKQVAGQCDVDLTAAGIQPGVPAVKAGDVVTAVSTVNSVATDFLSATFVQQ